MSIYTYKCPVCGRTVDKIRKMRDNSPVECTVHDDARGGVPIYMERVLAVPSKFQWGCVKGF